MEQDNNNLTETYQYTDDEIKANPKGILVAVMEAEKKAGSFDYQLRRKILTLSEGQIETYQAFVKDSWILESGRTYEEVEAYLNFEENWIEERRLFHKEIVEDSIKRGVKLSERVKLASKDDQPKVFVVRGNIGAGKTTAMRNHLVFKPLLDEFEEPAGVVSADRYKADIREDMGKGENDYAISHYQCHRESWALAMRVQERLFSIPGLSMAFDERFAYMTRITELIGSAVRNGRKIVILDLDVPLEISIVRTLKRNPKGVDPCVPYDQIRNGFIQIRNSRFGLEEIVDTTSEITYYLFSESKSTPLENIAEKNWGEEKIEILNENLFGRLMSIEASEREVQKVDKQIVDQRYIEHVQRLLTQQSFTPEEKKGVVDLLKAGVNRHLSDIVDEVAKRK